MSAWVPVPKPNCDLMSTRPTAALVEHLGISGAPGVRLSRDLLAVVDDEGFFYRFYSSPRSENFAHIIDPHGNAHWLLEVALHAGAKPGEFWVRSKRP